MGILIWILAIVLFVFVILKKRKGSTELYWPERGFTFIGSEIMGTFLSNLINRPLMIDTDKKVYNRAKELKAPFVGVMELGNQPAVYILDLDLMKSIFVKDFDFFMDRRPLNMQKSDPMLYKTLFFSEGPYWKELRGKMSPTFTTGKIRRMFELLRSSSTKLAEYIEKDMRKHNGSVNFNNAYERYTMDVIASTAFGIDARTFVDEDPTFQKMGKRMLMELTPKVIAKFLLLMIVPKVAAGLGLSLMDKEGEAFFTQVIMNAIKQREQSGVKRDDFLQLMLEARKGQLKLEEAELNTFEKDGRLQDAPKSDKVVLTDDVIVAQSILFILAGFDPTQAALLFLVYELALNPDIQEKLAQEVKRAREDAGGEFTYESINELEYLDKVLHETLRMYPPVTKNDRKTVADYKVPGTELVIPKGTMVGMPTYCIQHDEAYYPNPEKFDPERFSPEEKSKRHPMTFQPFGQGPRNCIGMRFAMTNLKMAIASLVDRFVIEPSEKTILPMKFSRSTSLKPEGAVVLKVKPRNQ